MTSNVSVIGLSGGSVPASVSAASAAGGGASSSPSDASSDFPAVPVHSPRIVSDPSVGFITEYLSANGGQVVSQTPSVVTVAYLRQGLTADGETRGGGRHIGTTA